MHVRRIGNAITEGLLGLAAHAAGRTPAWLDEEVPADVAAAIAAVGDSTGELWVHLLPLALELEATGTPPTPSDLLAHVAGMPPVDLLRLVVGTNVPAWHDCVDGDVLEAAASGDPAAALTLLGAPRYYDGKAAAALTVVLGLGPQAAAERIRAALRAWFDEVVEPRREDLAARHAGLAPVAVADDPLAVVEDEANVRFEPEPYTDEVVLVPQFTARGWRVMAQHHGARVIVHDAAGGGEDLAALADTFAALGDPTRLAVLHHLAHTPGGVSDVARAVGIAKSTAHQHLAVLREAGLLTLAGQAWRYRYEVRPERVLAAAERLHDHLVRGGGAPRNDTTTPPPDTGGLP